MPIEGFNATLKAFKKYQQAAPQAARAAVVELARAVYARSQELVPVSDPTDPRYRPSRHLGSPVPSGYLKESGGFHVSGVAAQGSSVAEVYYAASYAVWVHEVMSGHKVGQWKYLETAVKELVPTMPDVVGMAWHRYFAGAEFGAYGSRGEYVPPGGGE